MFDVEKVRRDFPILGVRVYDKPLVYLDSGATAQKPECVIETVDRLHRESNANIHRVLKSEEQPHAGTLLDGQRQQILLQEGRLATRDREFLVPGQHRSQRALSRAVRSHDGMHLAGLHLEVDALQYLFSGDLRP